MMLLFDLVLDSFLVFQVQRVQRVPRLIVKNLVHRRRPEARPMSATATEEFNVDAAERRDRQRGETANGNVKREKLNEM